MKINLIFDLKGDTVLKIDNEIIKKNTFLVETDLLKESFIEYHFGEKWKWIFIWSADKIGYEFIEIREHFKSESEENHYNDNICNFRTLAKWSYDKYSNELYKLVFNKDYFPDVSEIIIEIRNTDKSDWVLKFLK